MISNRCGLPCPLKSRKPGNLAWESEGLSRERGLAYKRRKAGVLLCHLDPYLLHFAPARKKFSCKSRQRSENMLFTLVDAEFSFWAGESFSTAVEDGKENSQTFKVSE